MIKFNEEQQQKNGKKKQHTLTQNTTKDLGNFNKSTNNNNKLNDLSQFN